jgi:hypothetical protein
MKTAEEVSSEVWAGYCSRQQDQSIKKLYREAMTAYANERLSAAIALCVDDGQYLLAQKIRDLRDGL